MVYFINNVHSNTNNKKPNSVLIMWFILISISKYKKKESSSKNGVKNVIKSQEEKGQREAR